MPKFVCCDCNKEKVSENALESHISIDHLLWIPYECIYCREVNLHTYEATEADLKIHFDKNHSDKGFTILYVIDEKKKKKLIEKMDRSKANSFMQAVNNDKTAELNEANKVRSPLVPPLVDLVSPPASPKATNEHNYAAPSVNISSTHPTEGKMQHINGFKCCHCSREFRWISQMKIHQDMTHQMNGDFSCQHCEKKFHNRAFLQTHSKSHFTPVKRRGPPQKDHKIAQMKRQQQSTTALLPKKAVPKRNQEVRGINRKVYFCQECQISIQRVNYHLGVHHLKKVVVSCGACSYGSKWSIREINKHIKSKHNGENVKVIDKRPEFQAELQLLKNQLIVLQSSIPEALKYCLKCDKSVSVSQVYNHLWRFHMDQTAMHCNECGYGTNLLESIRQHVNRQHKNAQIIDNRPQLKEQIKQMRNEFIVSEKPNSVQNKQSLSGVAPVEAVVETDYVTKTPESTAIDRLEHVEELLTGTVPKKYCTDCQSSIPEDKVYRHLAENHLKEVMVKCSLCDFGSYWGAGSVKKHIESEHKAQIKAQPVNERRKYKQQLDEMKNKWIIEKY